MIQVSKKTQIDSKKDKYIALVDNRQQPKIPKNLPHKQIERKLKKGNNKIFKYIILYV